MRQYRGRKHFIYSYSWKLWWMYKTAAYSFKGSRCQQEIFKLHTLLWPFLKKIIDNGIDLLYFPNIKVTTTLIQNCTSLKWPIKSRVKSIFQYHIVQKVCPTSIGSTSLNMVNSPLSFPVLYIFPERPTPDWNLIWNDNILSYQKELKEK